MARTRFGPISPQFAFTLAGINRFGGMAGTVPIG
jgi:hypothetical protein